MSASRITCPRALQLFDGNLPISRCIGGPPGKILSPGCQWKFAISILARLTIALYASRIGGSISDCHGLWGSFWPFRLVCEGRGKSQGGAVAGGFARPSARFPVQGVQFSETFFRDLRRKMPCRGAARRNGNAAVPLPSE